MYVKIYCREKGKGEEMLNIKEETLKLIEDTEKELGQVFARVQDICLYNTKKVMDAFSNNKLSEVHFNGTTGYGYDDAGREIIEKIYAEIFKAEEALVRIQFVNGTHALSTALMGNLFKDDMLLCVSGSPYDTLQETIGTVKNPMSLIERGVKYHEIDLINNDFNYPAIEEYIKANKVKMVFIGRSRGYTSRESLNIDKIEKVISFMKNIDKDILVMVDNCYGEFVEKKEPIEVGADLIAGSLIKNIGGGICETGGYIVGRKELVERAAEYLTAPGIGKECGATLGKNREILQGLFLAPQAVKNAIMTAILAAKLLEKLGYKTNPLAESKRTDIIQSIEFGDKEKLVSFIQGIQAASPVDSFVLPMPWAMPGYTDEVIMAAGTFISGASIELSADAPIREPYIAYLQGGLTYESSKLALAVSIDKLTRGE